MENLENGRETHPCLHDMHTLRMPIDSDASILKDSVTLHRQPCKPGLQINAAHQIMLKLGGE